MGTEQESHVLRGIVAGIAGGLAASWVMNQFLAGPGKKLEESLKTDEEKQAQQKSQPAGSDQEDATMKTADAVVNVATGGRHLSREEKEKGGPIVHYAFGAAMGALYGGLCEVIPSTKAAFGTTFGSALFVGADLVAVPALDLSGSPTEEPKSSLANHYAAHLVYGATTELVRRIVRAIL